MICKAKKEAFAWETFEERGGVESNLEANNIKISRSLQFAVTIQEVQNNMKYLFRRIWSLVIGSCLLKGTVFIEEKNKKFLLPLKIS